MKHVIKESDLEVIESKYLDSTIFPEVCIIRKMSRNIKTKSQMREVNFLTNSLLYVIMKMDYYVASKAKFGISGAIFAKK